MASNKRSLQAYVRYDGNGRIIPGSLILNRFKPEVGDWKETPAYECCNYTPPPGRILYFTVTQRVYLNIGLHFFCNEEEVEYVWTTADALNITELIEALNGSVIYTQFGVFSAFDSETVQLTMSESLALTLCPTGELTFQVTDTF
jgi:hypothetical protein